MRVDKFPQRRRTSKPCTITMPRTANTECDICGTEFYKRPKDKEKTDSDFCSQECMAENRSNRYAGSKNPNYSGGMETTECENCGESFQHKKSVTRRYCDRKCMGEGYTGGPHSRVEEDNVRYYGPNWQAKRRQRVIEDCGRCVICGMSDSAHHKNIGTGLHVHHVKPIANYQNENGTVDWVEANKIENLITMCWKCHQKWEGVPVVPQNEA